MIGLLELLRTRGFVPTNKRVKLVRHKDIRFDVEQLFRNGQLETYQEFQGSPIFDGCDQIISFVGEEGSKSRFVGIFDVGPRELASKTRQSQPVTMDEWLLDAKYRYPTSRRSGFEDLENRLVIDWGSGTRSWHQWLSDRLVLELRPEGRALPPFHDYLKVHLAYRELRVLAQMPDAHGDWIAGLSAVGGIYLIVSRITGQQYVGSATGARGIWQRWQQYAESGHCSNRRLVELCKNDPSHPEQFMFSILEVFSRTTAKNVALDQESFFKQKLGSRAFGLNDN